MSLKHGILGLLTYGEMSGYDLGKYFEQSLNFFWNAQVSQIYRELASLEEEGYVEPKTVRQEKKPDKKLYTVTEEGREELADWVNQFFNKEEMKIRDPFLMRVFFGAKGEIDRFKVGLKEYQEYNEFYLNKLKKVEEKFIQDRSTKRGNEQIFWLMTIKKGYRNFQANIDWAKEVLNMLEDF